MEEVNLNAYECAVEMLMAGRLPLCIPFDDDHIHVVACKVNNRDSLAMMIHDNPWVRAKFSIAITKQLRKEHDRMAA